MSTESDGSTEMRTSGHGGGDDVLVAGASHRARGSSEWLDLLMRRLSGTGVGQAVCLKTMTELPEEVPLH